MTKQQKRVLDYIQGGETITSLDAFTQLGITRLAAVIFDLKKAGHFIGSRRIRVNNRFNEKCNVSEYFYGGDTNAIN
tara:strand:- start:11034 stop:11264 length:231 start_codon:yes stop_codon:yes gene_type:complete